MKSKITIDVDYDNQPIIKIQHVESDDVRDKLVKRFLEKFAHTSVWCTHYYQSTSPQESWISPISPDGDNFKELGKLASAMQKQQDEYLNITKERIENNE